MPKTIEVFCLKCKEITTLKINGERINQYGQDNSIRIGGSDGKKITCKCGSSKLKFNGYLKKSDIL